ncbi:KilA-N domain-containing protein [Vibrio atlanticus]|nr:KilA-N domain-containing protein [Vibrio atlanticus]
MSKLNLSNGGLDEAASAGRFLEYGTANLVQFITIDVAVLGDDINYYLRAFHMTTLTILANEIRTLDGMYSLNDLHKASGANSTHRPNQFMRLTQTKELIDEITRCADLRISENQSSNSCFVSKQGGTNKGTWVCKELVYAYAMWISPTFMLKVIRAFDQLVSTPQLQTTSIDQNATLIQNANRAAERAYQLEQERQRELQELNDMVAQLERSTRIARNKIEIAMQSNNKQNDNLAHIDTMHSMLRLQ